jgi:hypothetical protein
MDAMSMKLLQMAARITAADEYREKVVEAAKLLDQANRLMDRLVQGELDTQDQRLKNNIEVFQRELDGLSTKIQFALRQGPKS